MAEGNSYVGEIRQFKLNTSDWSVYKPHLFNYFVANEINNCERRRAVFLNMLDEEAYRLITSLCYPVSPESTPFTALMLLFDGQFTPKLSVFAERYKFYNATRHKNETAQDWATRVKNLAVPCQFGSALKVCLRDKFVYGFEEDFFNCLEDDVNISFEDTVKLAREKQDVNQDDYKTCCHRLYMFRDFVCPFGCYTKSLQLSYLYGHGSYGYLLNTDY